MVASAPITSQMSLNDTLGLCYTDLGVMTKTFMPEAFSASFSPLHRDILSLFDSDCKQIAIAAPRGLGKTSFARAIVMRAILYRQYEFILYVSNSETVAELQTENIKRELRSNKEIRKIFGDIAIAADSDAEFSETFSKRAWVAYGSTLILPRGSGQQVRGLLYKHARPQLIIIDDLEKRDELENPENRRKLKEWFHSDLMKCINRYDNNYRIIYLDTLKHSDSLMEDLLNSNEWESRRLDLCNDTADGLVSNVPELISTNELRREYEVHKENGTLDIFYSEFRNLPIATENQGFRQEYFQHYSEASLDVKALENYVIVDPAKSVNMSSADSAIVGIGVDFQTGAIYVRDVVSRKMFPDELYAETFDMKSRLNAHQIGIEVTGLEEFIRQPFTNYMLGLDPRYNCELVWLKARGGDPGGEKGKLKRIGTLAPYYRKGHIYHNPTCTSKLEGQLLSFPKGKLVDVADATAYIIELLELGGRYFTSPSDEVEYTSEDEFGELDYEGTSALSRYQRI
jgi:hypothetical protein